MQPRCRTAKVLNGPLFTHISGSFYLTEVKMTLLDSLAMRITKRHFLGPSLYYLSGTDETLCFGVTAIADKVVPFQVFLDGSSAVCMD